MTYSRSGVLDVVDEEWDEEEDIEEWEDTELDEEDDEMWLDDDEL
jgi:hypothetical protein